MAVAAGAAAGAALGILFAPEKGSVLRKRIAERGKKVAEDLKERFETRTHEWKEKAKGLS